MHQYQFAPYEKRAVTFVELWQQNEWQVKIYHVGNKPLSDILLHSCHTILPESLPQPAQTKDRYGVGFVVVHQGVMANWLLINWWGHEDIIHQKIYHSPTDQPNKIMHVEDKSIMTCIHEMEVYEFERQAWISHVLNQRGVVNFEPYLAQRLSDTLI